MQGPREMKTPAQNCPASSARIRGRKSNSTQREGDQPASRRTSQDVRGSARFESCETEFRYSRCVRQGGVEAPVLWGRIAKYVLWKAEETWRAKGWDYPSEGSTTMSVRCVA